VTLASRSRKARGPATRVSASDAPSVAAIGTPLRLAPCPAIAIKNSSVTGANRHPTTGRRYRPVRRTPSSRAGQRCRRGCRRSDRRSRQSAARAAQHRRRFLPTASRTRVGGQPPVQQAVDRDVGFADRRRFVLEPVPDRGAKHRQRQRAGFAHASGKPCGDCLIDGLTGRQRSDPRRAGQAH